MIGALVPLQLAPESFETQTQPIGKPLLLKVAETSFVPSADEAMHHPEWGNGAQLAPELVERQRPFPATTKFEPSAEETTPRPPGSAMAVHVVPPSADVETPM